jgi:hypothetical protein
MKITGHKTRATFERYNIASVDDISAAIERTTAYVATLPTERKVAPFEVSQKTHTGASGRKAR